MCEQWKDIEGFKGSYQVSSEGRVRSLTRRCSRGYFVFGRVIKPIKLQSGHLYVNFRKDGTKHFYLIHRLVLAAFVGEPAAGSECCHNNGVPDDNRLFNLRWDTRKANCQDQIKHGVSTKGVRNPRSKLTEEQVCAILQDTRMHKYIALDYGVVRSAITAIKNGKNWGHLHGLTVPRSVVVKTPSIETDTLQ